MQDGVVALECSFTEFVGKRNLRRVCRSTDRVELVKTHDKPEVWEPLCREHAVPYLYDAGFEEADALDDELLQALAPGDPRVVRLKQLRAGAHLARLSYSRDRRFKSWLQEEQRLREEADDLLDELLIEAGLRVSEETGVCA